MRCPACAARNPAEAAWCSQCYAPLGSRAPAHPRDEAVRDGSDLRGPGSGQDRRAADGSPAEVPGRAVRASGEGFEWRCPVCTTWNDMDTRTCTACGAAFAALLEDGPAVPQQRDPQLVLLATLVLPGAGHVLLGRKGEGVLRVATFAACVIGALSVLGAGGVLPAVPLALGACLIWGLTAADAAALSRGSTRQLLGPRVLLWLVVGVVGGLIVSFLPALFHVSELSP